MECAAKGGIFTDFAKNRQPAAGRAPRARRRHNEARPGHPAVLWHAMTAEARPFGPPAAANLPMFSLAQRVHSADSAHAGVPDPSRVRNSSHEPRATKPD